MAEVVAIGVPGSDSFIQTAIQVFVPNTKSG